MGKRQQLVATCRTEQELRNATKDMHPVTARSYLMSWRKAQKDTNVNENQMLMIQLESIQKQLDLVKDMIQKRTT